MNLNFCLFQYNYTTFKIIKIVLRNFAAKKKDFWQQKIETSRLFASVFEPSLLNYEAKIIRVIGKTVVILGKLVTTCHDIFIAAQKF